MTRATDGRRMRVLLVLIAALALVFAGLSGPSAGASGGNTATSAVSKKCKKKSYRKKHRKKCRKKRAIPPQVVRATLTWTNGGSNVIDMDLFAFDANARIAGNGVTQIPNSSISPDLTGAAGTETFRAPARTVLSFGVCYTNSESTHTDYTISYTTTDGVVHTETRADDGVPPSLGGPAHVNYAGGAPIPDGYCPGTSLIS